MCQRVGKSFAYCPHFLKKASEIKGLEEKDVID